MITLGVTGGMGSGKTTVCRLLEQRGARVFYADPEARRLMHEDDGLRAAIVEAFGARAYDAAGHLDRAHVATLVFGDAQKLAHLNGLVHPRVQMAFAEARARAEADGVELLVKEAALLFEGGGADDLDAIAVVDAPLEVRVARVVARDGTTPEAALARIRHQMPADEMRRRADYVVENDGDLARLTDEVDALVRALRERFGDEKT